MNESEEMNFLLDTYDDLFSDFDNRDYERKSLSDDFLSECKKASLDKKLSAIELMITLPENLRNHEKEEIIKKRLISHFNKHHKILETEKRKELKKSLFMIFLGASFSIITTLINRYLKPSESLSIELFLVIFVPAAWFFLWEGLSKLIFEPENKKIERDFYKKMSSASIKFQSKKI